uniref:diguanylate cyclase n=1 Tax=Desulfatirhabdium butyrativorans TaxID=340467 RepID=A0A7C4MQB8_9BACT
MGYGFLAYFHLRGWRLPPWSFIVKIVDSGQSAVGSVFRPIFIPGGGTHAMSTYRENRGYGFLAYFHPRGGENLSSWALMKKLRQRDLDMESLFILIVDDDAVVRQQMIEFFRLSGFECLGALNAEEANAVLASQPVDILIVNLQMERTDGLDFIESVKKQWDVDVIAMTLYPGDYTYEFVVSRGASDFITKPVRYPELLLRIRRLANERTLRQEREEMIERLKILSITDDLTKLYNSRHFHGQIVVEVERANRYHHSLSLLMMDVDHFKKFNDRYGHLNGDIALAHVGSLVNLSLRAMDSAYRYGGEEFAVILPVTMGEEAKVVAERIRLKVEKSPVTLDDGSSVPVTLSIGVVDHVSGETANQLIRRADEALYISKESGRNRTTFLPAEARSAAA